MRFQTKKTENGIEIFDHLRIMNLVIDYSWHEYKIDQVVGEFCNDKESYVFVYRALFLGLKK